MKTNHWLAWISTLLLAGSYTLRAQTPLQVFASSTAAPPGYHVDRFWIDVDPDFVNRPLRSLSLEVSLAGLNQLNPDGTPTVFASPSMEATVQAQDSHFLLDPTQFTVLSQNESGDRLSASISFEDPVVFDAPGRWNVVQAVARDGHVNPDGTFGSFSYRGAFMDGGTFASGFAIIPEPAIPSYLVLGSLLLWRLGRASTRR